MSGSMRSFVNDSVFWCKQACLRPSAHRVFRQLSVNQHLSPDELLEINWKKRVHLLEHAYTRIPFYRQRFDSLGLKPQDIRTPEDWHNLPILTRDDVSANFENLLLPGVNRKYCNLSTTGGSTGRPIKVFHDRRFPIEALGWRLVRWWGLSPGDNIAMAYRCPQRTRGRRIANALMWWPTRRILLDASSMTPEAVERYLTQFNRLRPAALLGYVGAVSHLAEYIEATKTPIHSPKAVWVTSSPLSSVQRALIERVFRAPVYDQYGCCEVFWLAAQCRERRGLHIFFDARHIEMADDADRPCEDESEGRILVTDLENYVFPLIRYANGDIGHRVLGRCDCGVTLPMMGQVKGRLSDNVRLPDTTVIGGEFLTTLFDDFPDAVSAFQVYQQADYSLTIRVVPRAFDGLESVLEQVRQRLLARARCQVPINILRVDAIPSNRGKTQYVVSDICSHRVSEQWRVASERVQ